MLTYIVTIPYVYLILLPLSNSFVLMFDHETTVSYKYKIIGMLQLV